MKEIPLEIEYKPSLSTAQRILPNYTQKPIKYGDKSWISSSQWTISHANTFKWALSTSITKDSSALKTWFALSMYILRSFTGVGTWFSCLGDFWSCRIRVWRILVMVLLMLALWGKYVNDVVLVIH